MPVNKSGFASIYALYLLNIVVVAALLLLQIAMSVARAHQSDELFNTELIAIYRIKARLNEVALSSDTSLDEENKQEKEVAFLVTEEMVSHEDYTAFMYYHDQTVDVQIDALHFEVLCDLSTNAIMDIVYLS